MNRPSAARMYDYYLGGGHNFAINRAMADQGSRCIRGCRASCRRTGRSCGVRCGFWSMPGIDQFLDIGAGIPTVGNVHEIAQRYNPLASVAYVDIDPVAVAHGQTLLADNPLATAVRGDVRQPERFNDFCAVGLKA